MSVCRLWVIHHRHVPVKDPILGYVPKYDKIKEFGP